MELTLQALTRRYGATVAVDNISLSVGSGEFVAMLGPSGCGKTTTLRMVAGFVAPSSGRILLDGRDITGLPPERRDMGMVFQTYALFPHMTVRRNVAFGLHCRKLPSADIRRRVDETLEMVGLQGMQDRLPRQLSGGQQQRVALARVLALRPALLLFDEPLSNLDARLRVQMRREIRTLQRAVGITALFVTHDQEEAMAMADRIAVLDGGRLVQMGPPAEVYDQPRTRFVAQFLGTANLFAGRIAQTEGSVRHFVMQCGHALRLDDGAAAANGPATVAVRPECVRILAAGQNAELVAQVRAVTVLGGIVETRLALPDEPDDIIVHEPNLPDFRTRSVGTNVSVSIDPNHIRVLADDQPDLVPASSV